MTTFTIPEEIIGVPLFVPTIYDFFDIDSPGMPDDSDCLVVRGDLNNGYKAFIPAPVLAQNLFHTSDVANGRQWSMSCWLQLENLAVASTEGFMLGCSTQYTTLNSWDDNKNVTLPFALVANGVSGFRVWREPLNNVASPNHFKVNNFVSNTGWQGFQNYWFLFVITQKSTGVVGTSVVQTVSAYMDTYPNAIAADAETGGTLPSGVYQAPRYLHLGAYHAGGVGRADSWKIGKWAFHDHALTLQDRIDMWKAMMGSSHSYLDDFNRATLGNNWLDVSSMAGITIVSNQIKWTTSSQKAMTWVRCLGSPNMYSQMDVISNGFKAQVTARNGAYLTPASGYYSAGWSQFSARWEINNGSTLLVSSGGAAPTPPYTIRLETETNVSGDVLLRLYLNGSLHLSATDSSGSKRLYECNAGVTLMGGSGDAIADNFRCGTLDTVTDYPLPYTETGGYQNFKVPAGVTTLIVDAYGAQGSWDSSGINGGLGGRVKCNVTVVPGEILRVYVGQQAPQVLVAGFGGGGDRGSGIATLLGGSGGGATFIRRAPYTAADTLIAAPGGGGKGANNGGAGGGGGTPTGTAGGASWGGVGAGGGGGTASAGGVAGTGGTLQTDGSQGQGGRGADASRSGGGGGGGWYGGGGGGGDGSAGGGGGGGSGLSTGVSETIQNAVRTGSGTITITW